MKVVAQQGEMVFIVQIENQLGCVVNTETQEAFKEFNIQSILMRGYWETPTASADVLEQAVALASKRPQ